jgi:hypothetical protein
MGNWETFPDFAEALVSQINAKIIKKSNDVTMHWWDIEYKNTVLYFIYEDYSNGVHIEPTDKNSNEIIMELFTVFGSEKSIDGF